jgi:hypothetical protein
VDHCQPQLPPSEAVEAAEQWREHPLASQATLRCAMHTAGMLILQELMISLHVGVFVYRSLLRVLGQINRRVLEEGAGGQRSRSVHHRS